MPFDNEPAPTAHETAFGADDVWAELYRSRQDRVAKGVLDEKSRQLVFVAGHLVNRYPDAARRHQALARAAGATTADFRLIVKILDFYRGLRLFQDAQKVVSLWSSGNFPELLPPESGSHKDIYDEILRSRTYIANGFRVYAADGEWLRLYLSRSDAIKTSETTLDHKTIQLLSMAVTLMNHRYSGNWNDGCIGVHEAKARSLGASAREVLEVVQILELCESERTAWEATQALDLS